MLTDHHADVYALASHPDRPGVLLSTSRDTTIRTWSMDDVYGPVRAQSPAQCPHRSPRIPRISRISVHA